MKKGLVVIILFLFIKEIFASADFNPIYKNNYNNLYNGSRYNNLLLPKENKLFRNDSINHSLEDSHHKTKGIMPWIAPTLLISSGTALHFSDSKKKINIFIKDHFNYNKHIDDYLLYLPALTVYGLNLAGVKGKNNYGNATALFIKSFLLNGAVTHGLKHLINEERPWQGNYSFPSSHTSIAFVFAHFMHKEFGEKSIWYSIGAYSCASTVGFLRIALNAHWASDVLAGAGIGILSTELIYLTHKYKWSNEHLKRVRVSSFQHGSQKGITLVYNF